MKDSEGEGILRTIIALAQIREDADGGKPTPHWFEKGDSFPHMGVYMNWRDWVSFAKWMQTVIAARDEYEKKEGIDKVNEEAAF